MRAWLLMGVVALTGCKTKDPLYCRLPDRPCTDPNLPFCDERGEWPASEGIAHTCIPDPYRDGGTPDSGLPPDGGPAPDASITTDAAVDATVAADATLRPPVTNGQAADLVLGQPDFTTRNAPTATATTFDAWSVATDGNRLWVADSARSRVLQWNGLPQVNGAGADLVIGQTSLTGSTESSTPSQVNVKSPMVVAGGGAVLISNATQQRVLIWRAPPTANAAAADLVMGQTNFTTSGSATSASGMSTVYGVWTDGTRVAVADSGNNRVLLWPTFPNTNGAAATVVLGQTAFGMNAAPNPPTAASMSQPGGVFFDGQRLYVADTGNNRVLVWRSWPTLNGTPADFALGQTSLSSRMPNAGAVNPTATTLNVPLTMVVSHGSLFIADRDNGRIVVHSPLPDSTGEAADAVLGKTDFASGLVAGTTPTANGLYAPGALAVAGNQLFVADSFYFRVLRFTLTP